MEKILAQAGKATGLIRRNTMEVVILLLIGLVGYVGTWLRQEITGRAQDNLRWSEKVIKVQDERNEAVGGELQLSEREVQRLRAEVQHR